MDSYKLERVLLACIDAMDRGAHKQVPNPYGIEVVCKLCGGHMAGALGWFHKDSCYIGRARLQALEIIKQTRQERDETYERNDSK